MVNAVQDRTRSVLEGSTVVILCAGDDTELADRLRTSLELGAQNVVVDLGDSEMIDAATLTTLKRVSGRLRSRGGHLAVVSPHPRLANLLDVTLLSRSFAVFASLDAALQHAAP